MAIKWNDYEINTLTVIIKYFDKLNFRRYKYLSEISNIFKNNENCEIRSEDSIQKKFMYLTMEGEASKLKGDLPNEILKYVKKKTATNSELSEVFNIPIELIIRFIKYLQSTGIPVDITQSKHVVYNNDKSGTAFIVEKKDEVLQVEFENPNSIKFGVVSDTHFGSKACEIEKLKLFYEHCHEFGITTMVHAGDMVDGIKVYKGQEYEQNQYGFGSQTDLVIDHYPKIEGMTTYTILGNHDYSFISICDTDPLERICMQRPDIVCIGKYFGEIKLGNFLMALHHPDAGNSYALSYKIQKILETLKTEYDGYIVGHYHQAISLYNYHSKWACLAGSFQNETMFSRRKGLRNVMGGYVVEISKNLDGSSTIIPSWVDYTDS